MVRQALHGKTTVLAGPSGVGKSSLINLLHPEAGMETGDISRKIERGKHTTRHSELFPLDECSYIMDTPGFSSLYVNDFEKEDLKMYFREFEPYEGECRFQGCSHIHEPGCRVKEALEAGKSPKAVIKTIWKCTRNWKKKTLLEEVDMKYILAPSILAADFKCLEKQMKMTEESGAEYLHFDVMDGMFVPSISFGMPVLKSIRNATDQVMDVHLMIQEPIRYVEEFAKAGADIITVHLEACSDVQKTIEKIRDCGKKLPYQSVQRRRQQSWRRILKWWI